jgi:hypothetical protein
MKKRIFTSLALLLVLAAVPVLADNDSAPTAPGPVLADNGSAPAGFQALSNLTAPGQMALDTMTDQDLASTEGQGRTSISLNISCDNCNVLAGYIVFEIYAFKLDD